MLFEIIVIIILLSIDHNICEGIRIINEILNNKE